MDLSNLLLLLAAYCVTEYVHNVFEVWGMRKKVNWLRRALQSKPLSPWPINIDSKAKTFWLHLVMLLVIGGGSYLLLKAINFSDMQVALFALLILIISYAYTTYKVDKFHAEIDPLIKKVRRRPTS